MKNQTNSTSNRAAWVEKVKELLEQLKKDSDELALNYSLKREN